jgi:hypothetical protein
MDKTKASDVTMCVMFEMMDSTEPIYEDDDGGDDGDELRRHLAEDDDKVRFEDFKAHMGSSNVAIKYSNMFSAFAEIAGKDDKYGSDVITQLEWKKYWHSKFGSAAESSSNSGQSAAGVSIGAVVGCVVAAVGAGIGIGYFAKGRQASQGSSIQEREMRMVLAQGDADAEL